MAWILNLILGPHRFETHSPWGVLTGICAIFGAVILSLVALVIGGMVITFAGPDSAVTCIKTGITGPAPGCSGWLLGMIGASSLLLIAVFYGLAHAREGSTPGNALLLRAANLRWWQYFALVFAMLAVVFASEVVVSLITGATQADFEIGIDYMKAIVAGAGWQNWLLIILVVVLAGPIMEEIFFRGFMFTMLIKTPIGFIGAAAITSACWTMMHLQYSWQILIVLFVFGLGLAYVVWRTGSLWPGIVAHSANNLASAVILALR